MADKFDPYREALVVETATVWPENAGPWSAEQMQDIAEALHSDPGSCSQLAYVRVPTGFCRQITVTNDDAQRVAR